MTDQTSTRCICAELGATGPGQRHTLCPAHDQARCAICDAPATVVNEATDAAPAYPACADHVKDTGYSVIDTAAAGRAAAVSVRRVAASAAAVAANRWLLNDGPAEYDLAEAEFHLTQALADVRRARELAR